MKFEEIDYESVIESHIKIFVYLANKYIYSLKGFEFEDLIQEQKIACYQALKKVNVSSSIGSFLYTVAENRIKSIYRFESRKKRKPKQLLYLENNNIEHVGMFLKSPGSTPEDQYYVMEIKQKASVVAKQVLSEFEYQLYIAVVEEGKDNVQIANAMGKTETQINNGIFRMRRKMREKRELIYTDV